jgi:hypothetical protein
MFAAPNDDAFSKFGKGVKPENRTKMKYALVRSRPTAKRSRWAFTSANSARGTASVRDIHVRPGMAIATLCIRRHASGGPGYRARTHVQPRSALRQGLGTRESATRSGARSAEKA